MFCDSLISVFHNKSVKNFNNLQKTSKNILGFELETFFEQNVLKENLIKVKYFKFCFIVARKQKEFELNLQKNCNLAVLPWL